MKMFAIALLGVCSVISAQENKTVKISLNFNPPYGSGSIEIYNDSYQRLAPMMNKLLKARRISVLGLIKEVLSEGRYTVEIYENDRIAQRYVVLNSQNVHDETNDRYLKCDVLSDIYRIFVHFLLQERMDAG
jgi:hypothetical protein